MKLSRFCRLAPLLCAAVGLRADVTLAPLFTDHAVLQRDKDVPVWGHASPGEPVDVSFHGSTASAKADASGRWLATLPPMVASGESADLVVRGRNTITLHDVVVGEVWLCSGQSNMEYSVGGHKFGLLNSHQEIAAAHYPLIRHFKVKTVRAETPIDSASGSWEVCDPQNVMGFTAVGYFFAREIYRKLHIPVGLINSTWGGTTVEAWMSPDALASDPAFGIVGQRWRDAVANYPQRKSGYDIALAAWNKSRSAAEAAGPRRLADFLSSSPAPYPPTAPDSPFLPGGLFNGMINPLVPYEIRGVLWYQGESNVVRAAEYHRLFAAMITGWRAHFRQGDFPFYWVQLPNFEEPGDTTHQARAFLREAQTQTLSLPNTGQAVTIDVGTPKDNHPTNKQEVGRRLALIAEARVYGLSVDFSGPVFAGATSEGSAMRVKFTYAENALTAAGKPLQSFELAGADRRFHPASAVISGDTVLVRSPEVPQPVAVRYAWRNDPEANLYNGAGLPAAPFRSDAW